MITRAFSLTSGVFLVIILDLLDHGISPDNIVTESTHQTDGDSLCGTDDKSLKRGSGAKAKWLTAKRTRSVKRFVVVWDTLRHVSKGMDLKQNVRIGRSSLGE
jgi:hypothetical protein